MGNNNYMEVVFGAQSQNEGFARTCVVAFCLQLNPTIDEIADIKTAVSEAVTNCVVHAYPKRQGYVRMRCEIEGRNVKIVVSDTGIGIKDIAKARQPFFTTKGDDEERSGMGFTVMEGFMDKVEVEKNGTSGVVVTMYKQIGACDKKVAGE